MVSKRGELSCMAGQKVNLAARILCELRYVPQIFILGHVLKLKLERLLLQVACFAAEFGNIGAVSVIRTSGTAVGTVRVLVGSVSAYNKYF